MTRQEIEILLTLVRERRTYVVKHTQAPQPVRDALRDLEDQLVVLLAAPDFRAAIARQDRLLARDIQLGSTSQQIRDEIIAKVGMMAAARTPEMQARYDAAVERERQLEAARNLEPDDCNIAAVGGARRCSSCGRPGGGHEVDCRRVQRLEREKLQAECDHQSGTVTRTTGDPPGPPCCGRCGLELLEPKPPARAPLIVQVPTLLSLVDDQLRQDSYPERDLVFATPVEGQKDSWIVDLVCGHKKAVRERKASYVCRECPKEPQ